MVSFIDSHAHLSAHDTLPIADELIANAQNAGISTIVNICTGLDSLIGGIELAKRYPALLFSAAATPPHKAVSEGDALFDAMAEQAKSGALVAVGETGLDYFYYRDSRDEQIKLFRRYLSLAIKCHLPVVIHCRDAFDDFFEIVDSDYKGGRGVLHCFTGTAADAAALIQRGWYISLSGIVTYKKSHELRDIAKIIPDELLLIETDTPYLAPNSKRSKPNQPAYLVETAQTIADARNTPLDAIATITTANACTLFNFNKTETR